MKDDDSSSIVRSQTAHQVNVSEYTGNATTPQNHVTSDVDREIQISERDAGPTREISTAATIRVEDTPHARLNTQTVDAPHADASDAVRIEADAPMLAPDQASVAVDAFQDELAAIERARDIAQRQRVQTEPLNADRPIDLPTSSTDPFASVEPDGLADVTSLHSETLQDGDDDTFPVMHSGDETAAPDLAEPIQSEHHVALPTAVEAPHLEALPAEPVVSGHGVGEAKPAFSDSHALLPEQGEGLHDPELDLAELGHVHPLSDHEPDPDQAAASLPAAPPHLHTPPHAPSPTNAVLADLNKDEFQGRLAGIKREVQALNDRLTDFEAELDKDGIRPTRP